MPSSSAGVVSTTRACSPGSQRWPPIRAPMALAARRSNCVAVAVGGGRRWFHRPRAVRGPTG
eukprot:3172356-Lingulodinium_polyedra.AAC.1